MISKNADICCTDSLETFESSSSHVDKVALNTVILEPFESLATFPSKCRADSQSRRSSASISPVEDLVERMRGRQENSQSCHSESVSIPRYGVPGNADFARGDTVLVKGISYLSPQAFWRRYSLFPWEVSSC